MISKVYLSLGGNIGDSSSTISHALELLKAVPEVTHLRASRFYSTSPILPASEPFPQEYYTNAACELETSLSPHELLKALQSIETELGKIPKAKNAPRIIDIDILFFGDQIFSTPDLELPHPRWKERLFVLTPLSDLVQTLSFNEFTYNLSELIKSCPNSESQWISLAPVFTLTKAI